MKDNYKLIRFSNGEQIIGNVIEDQKELRVENIFKTLSKETAYGYVTGVVQWIDHMNNKPITINKDHVTFITPLRGEIVEYIKKQRYRDEKNMLSSVSLEDIETKYKEDWEKRMLYYANTSSSGVH